MLPIEKLRARLPVYPSISMSSLKALTTGSTCLIDDVDESGDSDGDRLFTDDVTTDDFDDDVTGGVADDDVDALGVGVVFLNSDW